MAVQVKVMYKKHLVVGLAQKSPNKNVPVCFLLPVSSSNQSMSIRKSAPLMWKVWSSFFLTSPAWILLLRTRHMPVPEITKFPFLFSHCVVSNSFVTPWTVARQAPLSVGFPRQKYWSGLPFPFSKGSAWPRDQTQVSCISSTGRQILYHRATREAHKIPLAPAFMSSQNGQAFACNHPLAGILI